MKPPPPRFPASGQVTARVSATATAASIAFPPRFMMSAPTREAIASTDATIAWDSRTGSRDAACKGRARRRSKQARRFIGAKSIQFESGEPYAACWLSGHLSVDPSSCCSGSDHSSHVCEGWHAQSVDQQSVRRQRHRSGAHRSRGAFRRDGRLSEFHQYPSGGSAVAIVYPHSLFGG